MRAWRCCKAHFRANPFTAFFPGACDRTVHRGRIAIGRIVIAGKLTDQRGIFLSTLPAGRRENRFALAVIAVSVAVFIAAAPFAKLQLAAEPAFIPIIASALVINDLITAVMLFGQFSVLRAPALLVLASAYVFTAVMTVAHALSFPGLFSPTGLLGAGVQSTAWLYIFWHGGFPLLVIAYAFARDGRQAMNLPRGRAGIAILFGIAAVLVLACALILAATAWHDTLPAVMEGNRIAPLGHDMLSGAWMLSLLALGVLWWRRPHSVLDLWLMVALCAWIFDIALSAMLNAGRHDLGFYVGRIYGVLAGSFVLIMLLLQSGNLYLSLVAAFASEREQRELMERTSAELMTVNRALTVSEQRLNLALNSAQLGAWDLDLVSDTAVRSLKHDQIFGYENLQPEWGAAIFERHILPEDREHVKACFDEAFKSGLFHVACRIVRPDKMVRWIAADGMVIRNEHGQPARMLGVVADFTERRKAEEQIRELNASLEQRAGQLEVTNMELEGFSYSVSHDLRSPLRAIDGYSQMLEEDHADKLDQEGRRLLGVIRASSQNMAALIDDLLAFSRLGRQAIVAATVDMNALVQDVLRELGAAGAVRSPRIAVADLPRGWGDRALLKQVWINLLANAIKFAGGMDPPIIGVSGSNGATENIYSVTDNGVGFDMKYYNKLFGVFQRLHSADEFPGTGVGLAIVQRVVSRHGGRVWAEGKLNHGAAFFFSLPQGEKND